MQSEWNAPPEPSRDARTPIEGAASPCLRALVEDEYFLRLVLGASVVDGVPSYRCVCRRWNNVCRRLPVRLSWMWHQRLPDAVDAFPNAASVAVDLSEAKDCGKEVLDRLKRFPHLQHVTLVRYEPWTPSNALASAFQSLRSLRSISIVVSHQDVGRWFSEALRHLKQLTSLDLEVLGGGSFDVKPFTELRNVERLTLSSNFLANRRKRFHFSSLTSLTSLSISGEGPSHLRGVDGLQLVQHHGRSLRRLKIDSADTSIFPRSWSLLTSFAKLERLDLPSLDTIGTNLFEVLGGYGRLKELRVNLIDTSAARPEALFSLIGLEALSIAGRPDASLDGCPWHLFARLSRLTSLSLTNIPVKSFLCDLHGMKQLEIRNSNETAVGVPETLMHMPLLEELSLENVSASDALSNALWTLHRLRDLKLHLSTDDVGATIAALSHLEELTSLEFGHCGEVPCFPTLTQLNHLRNLRRLDTVSATIENPRVYLHKGCLQDLEWLVITCPEFDDDDRDDLTSMFPSLTRIDNESEP